MYVTACLIATLQASTRRQRLRSHRTACALRVQRVTRVTAPRRRHPVLRARMLRSVQLCVLLAHRAVRTHLLRVARSVCLCARARHQSTRPRLPQCHPIARVVRARQATLVMAAHRSRRAVRAGRRALVLAAARNVRLATGRRHRVHRARRVRAVHSRPLAVAVPTPARRGARALRAKARRQRAHPRRIARVSRVWQARRGLVPTMAQLAWR